MRKYNFVIDRRLCGKRRGGVKNEEGDAISREEGSTSSRFVIR
jgi:hypothetical protein